MDVIIGQFGDERYIIGVLMLGLVEGYKALSAEHFALEINEDGSLGETEEAIYPDMVKVYPAWTKSEITPPMVYVNAMMDESIPFGFGEIYFMTSQEAETGDKEIPYSIGRHIITGTVSIGIIAEDVSSLRSLKSKIESIVNSKTFEFYTESNGVYLQKPLRYIETRAEEVSEVLKYFVGILSCKFRSDWVIGQTGEETTVAHIKDIVSFVESIRNGQVMVELRLTG